MAILTLCLVLAMCGAVLSFVARRCQVTSDRLAERIDALLPQTQCERCGYPGCRPYAGAIARGEADINLCPPGGEDGIKALADLLGMEAKPLAAKQTTTQPKHIAVIAEELCVGCTLCIQACPVDAIVGAHKLLHTVIKADCTGCELCLPPCPVDCIVLQPVRETEQTRHAISPGMRRNLAISGDGQHSSAALPVVRTTDRGSMADSEVFPNQCSSRACIRCGACAEVCPAGLLPQQMYWFIRAGNLNRAMDYQLFACIECGSCDPVCPSQIPLTQQFRAAKNLAAVRQREREQADRARARFLARQMRQEEERRERIEVARQKQSTLARPEAAEIAQAVARAKARKRQRQAASSD